MARHERAPIYPYDASRKFSFVTVRITMFRRFGLPELAVGILLQGTKRDFFSQVDRGHAFSSGVSQNQPWLFYQQQQQLQHAPNHAA